MRLPLKGLLLTYLSLLHGFSTSTASSRDSLDESPVIKAPFDEFEVNLDESRPFEESVKPLGQLTGISIPSSDGSKVVLLHRGDRVWDADTFDDENVFRAAGAGPIAQPTIAEMVNGKIVKQYGENLLYLPHSITVDHEGNIWLTDVGLHQVLKLSANDLTKPSLVLGEKLVPGSDKNHFCKPTDVAVASNGDFFVSDGYCNSRILKFDKNGKFVKEWGGSGNDSAIDSYDLVVPHQLALIEHIDTICVADRENERMVCYSAGLKDPQTTGTYLFQTAAFSKVYGIAYNQLVKQYLLLIGPSADLEPSDVEVYDGETLEQTNIIKGPYGRGFGDAHTIASCQPNGSTNTSCFAVLSTDPPYLDADQLGTFDGFNTQLSDLNAVPRFWFFRISPQSKGREEPKEDWSENDDDDDLALIYS